MLQCHKYVRKENSTEFKPKDLCQERRLGGHLEKSKCNGQNSPVQCGKGCTINPGNGDHLSVRKIVKTKSILSGDFTERPSQAADL